MMIVPQVAELALMTELVAVLPGTGTLHLHLYQNNIIPGANTVLGDFVEATFDGYALAVMATAGMPFLNADGAAEQDYQVHQFLDTGAVTPNTIYGYYVTQHPAVGADILLWAERFDAPVVMDHNGAVINVAPQLTAISEF